MSHLPNEKCRPDVSFAKVGSCKAQLPEVYKIDSDGCYKMP